MGIWLVCLLALATWYQNNYIHHFTENQTHFLNSQFTENWFKTLSNLLPNKTSKTRVIQFWNPDCVCNRFASRHAISVMGASKKMNTEHITIIPSSKADQVSKLRQLNPETQIITLSSHLLPDWPSSPSVFIEDALGKLLYFGPLGFGAFCSDTSTNTIENQLNNAIKGTVKPFFNVIGKGCFCDWKN